MSSEDPPKPPTPVQIMDKVVEQLQILLDSNIEEDLLHSSMLGLIESTPTNMHSSVMLKFTFMLGYHWGLTREQIYKELLQ